MPPQVRNRPLPVQQELDPPPPARGGEKAKVRLKRDVAALELQLAMENAFKAGEAHG